MFKRIVFSACLAGLLAGLVLTAIQQIQVIPIILEAETYETSVPTPEANIHQHEDDAHHHHDSEAWGPEDGWQRTLFTAFANVLVAIGFALLLAAAFSLRPSFRWQQGLLWGLAGYLVFFVLPSLGLHPEIPGTVSAELSHRQAWWLLTVACSGGRTCTVDSNSPMALERQWHFTAGYPACDRRTPS